MKRSKIKENKKLIRLKRLYLKPDLDLLEAQANNRIRINKNNLTNLK